ncbi:MAG: hypothetical protein QNJ30_01955 [Kiloniellales bacterium]|nr:hypothetical protein [Kiloniellales bacterium]
MSFNPLMTLVVRSAVELLDQNPSVLELGNQTFNSSTDALDSVIERSQGRAHIDLKGLKELRSSLDTSDKQSAAGYYRCLGFSQYEAIDINDTYGSKVMDLNKDVREAYGFTSTYDLVTNNGTGEHIFDQASVLRNMHNMTKANGIMVHVMPMLNYVNHGFYCFHPSLYYSLARANRYHLLCLALANRRGAGVATELDGGAEKLPSFLLEGGSISLSTMLGKARFENERRYPLLKRLRRGLLGRGRSGNELGDVIHSLVRRFKNVLIVAVLRKVSDEAFQPPIQTLYADDFSDPEMQSGYSTDSPAVAGAR